MHLPTSPQFPSPYIVLSTYDRSVACDWGVVQGVAVPRLGLNLQSVLSIDSHRAVPTFLAAAFPVWEI